MPYFRSKPAKLIPAAQAGAGSELFIVEGDSASAAVASVREARFQAVLPMQGKPLNAWRASAPKVLAFELYLALQAALGMEPHDAESAPAEPTLFDALPSRAGRTHTCHYDRILLLFDPDADGIHCGALMLMYFYRWHRDLLEAGLVEMVRAPMFEIHHVDARGAVSAQPTHAWSDLHRQQVCDRLTQQGAQHIHTRRHRGLGGIDPELLRTTCVLPATRTTATMTVADARMAIRVFAPD